MNEATEEAVRKWDTHGWKGWTMVAAVFFAIATLFSSLAILANSTLELIERAW